MSIFICFCKIVFSLVLYVILCTFSVSDFFIILCVRIMCIDLCKEWPNALPIRHEMTTARKSSEHAITRKVGHRSLCVSTKWAWTTRDVPHAIVTSLSHVGEETISHFTLPKSHILWKTIILVKCPFSQRTIIDMMPKPFREDFPRTQIIFDGTEIKLQRVSSLWNTKSNPQLHYIKRTSESRPSGRGVGVRGGWGVIYLFSNVLF